MECYSFLGNSFHLYLQKLLNCNKLFKLIVDGL